MTWKKKEDKGKKKKIREKKYQWLGKGMNSFSESIGSYFAKWYINRVTYPTRFAGHIQSNKKIPAPQVLLVKTFPVPLTPLWLFLVSSALTLSMGTFSLVGFTKGRINLYFSFSLPHGSSAMTETPLSTCLWGKDNWLQAWTKLWLGCV